MSSAYIKSHLRGILAMAFDHEGWEDYLDRTVDGVFRSFWVLVPGFFIALVTSTILGPAIEEIRVSQGADAQEPASLSLIASYIFLFLRYVLDWFLVLGFLVIIARKLRTKISGVDLVIGYNWVQLMITLLAIIPSLVYVVSRSADTAILVMFPVLILTAVLMWGILRRSMHGIDKPLIALVLIGVFIVSLMANNLVVMLAQLVSH